MFFLADIIPIIGFPIAFIWAWIRMRGAKTKGSAIKLAAVTAALLIFNAAVTLFAYTLTINIMKNTLAKAAYSQNEAASRESEDGDSQNTNPGTENNIEMQDIPGMNSGMIEQIIPGFAGMQGGGSYNPDDYQVPDYTVQQETDEGGSPDTGGSFEDGRIYMDSDGDGKNDSYLDENGNFIPLGDKSKTDAEGNIYIDYDGDGNHEIMIDTGDIQHYDSDGDGVYEATYEPEWGDK